MKPIEKYIEEFDEKFVEQVGRDDAPYDYAYRMKLNLPVSTIKSFIRTALESQEKAYNKKLDELFDKYVDMSNNRDDKVLQLEAKEKALRLDLTDVVTLLKNNDYWVGERVEKHKCNYDLGVDICSLQDKRGE